MRRAVRRPALRFDLGENKVHEGPKWINGRAFPAQYFIYFELGMSRFLWNTFCSV